LGNVGKRYKLSDRRSKFKRSVAYLVTMVDDNILYF
jgi:hypothetical protein